MKRYAPIGEIQAEIKEVGLNPYVIGKTKLNLFVLYKVWVINVLMFLVALILLIRGRYESRDFCFRLFKKDKK